MESPRGPGFQNRPSEGILASGTEVIGLPRRKRPRASTALVLPPLEKQGSRGLLSGNRKMQRNASAAIVAIKRSVKSASGNS